LNKKEEKKLSRAALETLAIIAYHQPVTRPEIENIRGVATSKGTLDALMESGWIKPGKRREAPGRPVTWITTSVFMDDFGIENLNDLPGMNELRAAGLLDSRPAIETIPGAVDLFGNTAEETAVSDEGEEAAEDDVVFEDKNQSDDADEAEAEGQNNNDYETDEAEQVAEQAAEAEDLQDDEAEIEEVA
jgi:segregation and condensation protein B